MIRRKLGFSKVNGKRMPLKGSNRQLYLVVFENGQEVMIEATQQSEVDMLAQE